MNVRGVQRFGGLTYQQIAEFTGLRLSTIQGYGGKRLFDPHDTIGTIRWINEQRLKRGWPLLGIPDEVDTAPNGNEKSGKNPEKQPDLLRLYQRYPSGYNPNRAEYDSF